MMTYLATLLLNIGLAAGWTVHVRHLLRRLSAARRDPLTGLLTRAGWTCRAERITRSRRSAVLLLDLNGFKPINDRFGHGAGDTVLAGVGERLTAWCASSSGRVAGRLGGDEFVIALADATGLDEHLAELHTTLSQPVHHGGRRLVVTASIGACRLADLDTPTLSAALHAADQDMYRNKGRGRRGRRRLLPTLLRQAKGRLTRSAFRTAA